MKVRIILALFVLAALAADASACGRGKSRSRTSSVQKIKQVSSGCPGGKCSIK